MVEQAAGQKLSNPKQSMFARFGKGIALVLVMSVFTMPLSASALWSDSRELSVASLNAATVAPPTSFSCADVRTGPLRLVNEGELAWKGSPQATSYVIEFLNPEGSTLGSATVNEPRVPVTSDFLSGVVKGLLELLLGGTTIQVKVSAVGPGQWTSIPTAGVHIQNAGLLTGLSLSGVACK